MNDIAVFWDEVDELHYRRYMAKCNGDGVTIIDASGQPVTEVTQDGDGIPVSGFLDDSVEFFEVHDMEI